MADPKEEETTINRIEKLRNGLKVFSHTGILPGSSLQIEREYNFKKDVLDVMDKQAEKIAALERTISVKAATSHAVIPCDTDKKKGKK